MKKSQNVELSSVLSIMGLAASLVGTATLIERRLSGNELLWSGLSVGLASLAGVFSVYVAEYAKRFSTSPRIFLSYSFEDKGTAAEIAVALRERGARVWSEQERLKPGASVQDEVLRGINDADTVVVLLSGSASANMALELRLALKSKRRIIPVLLPEAKVPSGLRKLKYVDLRDDKSKGLAELIEQTT